MLAAVTWASPCTPAKEPNGAKKIPALHRADDTGPGGSCSGTNPNDIAIPDAGAAVDSDIVISGCSATPSTASTVAVNIRHTYIGDLTVALIAPDGSSYTLHNRSGGSTDNITTCPARPPTARGSSASATSRRSTSATSTPGRST